MVESLAMVSTIVEHENIVLARLHLTVFKTTVAFLLHAMVSTSVERKNIVMMSMVVFLSVY